MPRNRTIHDDDLLAAALEIVHATGPASLSFGALADRVGLAGSTLVQRFGSRADMLQAALVLAWQRLEANTAAAIAAAGDGPDGVVDMLVSLSGQYDADDFADQLLVLREDLRDPVLRARGATWLATLEGAVEARLTALPGGPDGTGRLIVAQWQGTLTVWSFTRTGALPDAVRATLTSLLRRLSSR